jgi:hypothetical protein
MIKIPNRGFVAVWDFCILEVLSYVVLGRQVVKENLQTGLLTMIAVLLLVLVFRPQPRQVGRFVLTKGENEETALDTQTGQICMALHVPGYKTTPEEGPECSTIP